MTPAPRRWSWYRRIRLSPALAADIPAIERLAHGATPPPDAEDATVEHWFVVYEPPRSVDDHTATVGGHVLVVYGKATRRAPPPA